MTRTTPHDPGSNPTAEQLLTRWIGLDPDTIGQAAIARAVRIRMEALGLDSPTAALEQAAADSAERAARLAPHHADAWATLAKYQLGAGRAAAALAHASRAIELDPADAAAALTLATAAFQLRDDTAAARAWAGLGELGYTDRDLAIIFHERGVEHLQAGRDAEAAIDFGIAMDRARDHPRAATNLGLALSRLGLFDAAVAAFREALDRDPGNEAARAGLQDAGAKRAAAAPSRASGGPAREGDEAGRGPGEQGGEEEPPRPPLAEE